MSYTDKEILDWLERQRAGDGVGWVCYPQQSRGVWLAVEHTSEGLQGTPLPNIRQALAAAMDKATKDTEIVEGRSKP